MYKESQSRSFKDKLKDYNPFSSSLKLFNSDIKNIMGEIRGADRSLRRIFTSDNSPEKILKQCKSLFKKREYMQCVVFLDLFREKLYNASQIQIKLNDSINLNYKNFFISQLKGKEKQDLIKFRDKMDKKQAQINLANFEQMVKNAGVTDWFRSIFTQRGRALRTWEKTHSQEVAGLKEGLVLMMDQAQTILNNAYSSLKEMSLALAQREISVYLKQFKNFKNYHKDFDKDFIKFYNDKVKDILSQLVKDEDEDDGYKKPERSTVPNPNTTLEIGKKKEEENGQQLLNFSSNSINKIYLNQDRIKQARQNLTEKAKLI